MNITEEEINKYLVKNGRILLKMYNKIKIKEIIDRINIPTNRFNLMNINMFMIQCEDYYNTISILLASNVSHSLEVKQIIYDYEDKIKANNKSIEDLINYYNSDEYIID